MLLIATTSPSIQRTARVSAQTQPSQSPEVDRLLRETYQLAQQGKLDEALAMCLQAISLSPENPRPHILAGLIYGQQRKLEAASKEFEKAIRLNPKDTRVYLFKAGVDRFRNDYTQALATLRQALEIDPNLVNAHMMIGEILQWDEKRRAEAITAYQTALKIDPKLFAAYEGLGEVYQTAKNDQKAEESFRQAMSADPAKMSGRFKLGRLLVKQGRLAEARELWNGRTADEDRTFPNFIELLKRAERLKAAQNALAKSPKDPDALTEMGFALMEGDSWVVDGRQERAIVYFRQALEVSPDKARAQYGIVKAYIEVGDIFKDKAKGLDMEMERLKRLDPKLAKEMEEYRKTYHTGLRTMAPVKD